MHLELFGLTCNDPKQLSSGARVLGKSTVNLDGDGANTITTGWDDETQDPMLRWMLEEIVLRSSQTDPAHGQEVTAWVDASSLATSVAIEYDGAIIEDAS